jgi:hypothetical protein
MVLSDFANELVGDIPRLSYLRARSLVQRAWHDIRDSRRWSFLVSEGVLIAPAQMIAGTVTVTQYSASVVGDATAGAAWAAAVLPASGVDMTTRQFRLSGGPIYNISAYDPDTFTLTLDRAYQEASGSGQTYQIYRCYYPAPSADFMRWISVVDPITKYRFRKRNLHLTKAEIDRRDPYRGAVNTPVCLAFYKTDSTGRAIYEMWPHPTANISYVCLYSRRGEDFTATETLPAPVSEDLLMSGARIKAYDWAQANAGRFLELQGTNWAQLRASEQKSYALDLFRTQRNDEEAWTANYSENEDNAGISGPVDAAYFQANDVFSV